MQGPAPGRLREFWHVASGDRPVLDPETDRWRIRADTGIVLILVPKTSFLMGAQGDDPQGANYDPFRIPHCEPVHRVELEPFFLSKYEMTQAQWFRLTGENPSRWTHEGEPGFGCHPVEQIQQGDSFPRLWLTWELVEAAESWLECAARAGTDTNWFGGWGYTNMDILWKYANIKDQSYARGIDSDDVIAPWDDGFADHAPVGSFEPNPWGFHDILGNVHEWAAELAAPYELPLDKGGHRPPGAWPNQVVLRGGSYSSNTSTVNSSYRAMVDPSFRSPGAGIRPGRRLEPMDAYPSEE